MNYYKWEKYLTIIYPIVFITIITIGTIWSAYRYGWIGRKPILDRNAWELVVPASAPGPTLWRIQTPDGWILADDNGLTTYQDPEHIWLIKEDEYKVIIK